MSSFGSSTLNASDYDPNAAVQTGPGIPTWEQYNTTLYLKWHGPVSADQRIHLFLIGPLVTTILSFLRSALLALLLLALLRFPGRFWPERLKATRSMRPSARKPRPVMRSTLRPRSSRELSARLTIV